MSAAPNDRIDQVEPLDPDSPEGQRVQRELGDHMARVEQRIARDKATAAQAAS